MRNQLKNPKLKFFIGDVRDYGSVEPATRGVDFIFHAAALKQVPSCEFFPMQAVKTNVEGTQNVIKAAGFNGVKKVICLSTDKAAYPINAMGMSKALMEKVMVAKSRILDTNKTIFCGTRYGNVMASRGSVIPLFLDQIKENKALTLTDPNMTRFMMTLDEAVDLVLYAFEHGQQGEIFVQKAPAATIDILASALIDMRLHLAGSNARNYAARHKARTSRTTVTSRISSPRTAESVRFLRIPMTSPTTRDSARALFSPSAFTSPTQN
jgi:UDP-glucose 4-epimerase